MASIPEFHAGILHALKFDAQMNLGLCAMQTQYFDTENILRSGPEGQVQ